MVGTGRLLSVRPPGGKSDLERLMRDSWELSTVPRSLRPQDNKQLWMHPLTLHLLPPESTPTHPTWETSL